MPRTIKLLGVHGVGDHRDGAWKDEWKKVVAASIPNLANGSVELQWDFLEYDDIFAGTKLEWTDTLSAAGKLSGSAFSSWFGSRKRGLFDSLQKGVSWTAGYVVAWVESREFQRKTRERALKKLKEFQPDVVLAHSLGTLVTYNAFSDPFVAIDPTYANILKKLKYVTFGSQLNNPFVVGNLTPGRLSSLPTKRWYHLYNQNDHVFTAPISLPEMPTFLQLETTFDSQGFWGDGAINHSATSYLSHSISQSVLWPGIATEGATSKSFSMALPRGQETSRRAPRRRALLIGINDYPMPGAKLDGCVNDTFMMSSVLQECGFQPEDIRLCLNDRATARGILERMDWLLSDPREGDELVFYFSGHGTQLATYGEGDQVDQQDETLVPYDFDWTPERSITDDHIFSSYAQLPYGTRLIMIFDCCHSGGIHRAGSGRVKGLEPPDDIRHREMQWNAAEQMWEERKLKQLNKGFSTNKTAQRLFCGESGTVRRLGRAMRLRNLSQAEYRKLTRKSKTPIGPYLPLIIEACQEHEFAAEYRNGNESYGAFTFSLAQVLRERKKISFKKLVAETGAKLKRLGYEQKPQILGPTVVMEADVPWRKKS